MNTVTVIEKENLGSVAFPAEDVLKSSEDQKRRLGQLNQATSLGNLEHGKVHIRFATTEGICEVHTTIWHADEKHIVLKGGQSIPTRCILEVKI